MNTFIISEADEILQNNNNDNSNTITTFVLIFYNIITITY